MYALDKHDKHVIGADEGLDLHCVSVFTPPIQGSEQINEEGVLPFMDDKGTVDYEYWKHKEANQERIMVDLTPKQYRDSHYYDLVKEAIHSS